MKLNAFYELKSCISLQIVTSDNHFAFYNDRNRLHQSNAISISALLFTSQNMQKKINVI